MVQFVETRGLRVIRVAGSHHFMDGGANGPASPSMGARPLKIGTLPSILRDIELSPVEFARLWHD
jgi:predicted RNA binding protein YcfA (HicA-like mRNA interferase family)